MIEMTIGVLAHLCKKGSFEDVAQAVGEQRLTNVQLALWKAFNYHDFTKPGQLSPSLAKLIKEIFLDNGITISVLGSYLHLFDRDEVKRRENLERFKEIIRHANYFGAPVVATETGKLPLSDFTAEDWTNMVASIKELVAEGEKWGVIIGIEPAEHHLIDNAEKLKQLLEEVDSPNLGVVLDPGNLVTTSNITNQDEVIEEMFHLLGKKIVAFQAKDCLIDDTNQLAWVPVGKGQLNYPLILEKLWEYKPHMEIILDAVKPEDIKEAKAYLEKLMMEQIGVMQR